MDPTHEPTGDVDILDRMFPDVLWNPKDKWSVWKGYGRIIMMCGIAVYAIGLLGMRMELEQRRGA